MSSRSSLGLSAVPGTQRVGSRPSRRAALGRWWTASTSAWSGGLGKTTLPSALGPFGPVACDGTDVWVGAVDRVFRIRASDGKLLEEWSIRKAAGALLVAMGRVFVAGFGLHGEPGTLSMIDPRRSPGEAAVVATALPTYPFSPAFDGERILILGQGDPLCAIPPSLTLLRATDLSLLGVHSLPDLFPLAAASDGLDFWITVETHEGSALVRL